MTMVVTTKTVQVEGREIAVGPIKVRHLPLFVDAFEPAMRALAAQADDDAAATQTTNLMCALARQAPRLSPALEAWAALEPGWLDDQEVSVFLVLLAALVQENPDFFALLRPDVTRAPVVSAAAATQTTATAAATGFGGTDGALA